LTRNRPESWLPWLAGILAIAAGIASVGGGFVWDDRWLILQSPLRQHPGLLPRMLIEGHGWGSMTLPEDATLYYRPLATLLHGLLIFASGAHALPFRLLSIGLHAGTSVLIGIFLARRAPRAAVGALIFAVHPALADAYGWIAAMPDLLAAGLVMATLILVDRGRVIGAAACLWLALLAKESAVVAALWVPALVWGGVIARPRRAAWIGLGGALVLYLVVRAATVGFHRGVVEYPPGVAVGGPVLIGRLFLADMERLLAPARMTLEAPVWVTARGSAVGGIVGIVLGLALAAVAARAMRPTPTTRTQTGAPSPARGLALAYILCLAALLPVLQIVPTNDIFGGRFLVLPAAGMCIGIGMAIGAVRRSFPRPVAVAFAALILLLGARAAVRAGEWVSEERLFGDEYRRQPECIRARLSWASYLISAGRIADATPVVEGTLGRLPDHPRVRYQQALLWMNQGRAAEAETIFRDLVAHWKRTPTLLANLAGCQMRLGRLEDGLATLDEATKISTPTPGMRNNRGIALMQLGRAAEARREFEAAIADDPSYAPARVNLTFLLARDDAPAARSQAEEFLRRFPGAAEAARVRALVDTLGTGRGRLGTSRGR
jgi:protein O-mannosyl-transferase